MTQHTLDRLSTIPSSNKDKKKGSAMSAHDQARPPPAPFQRRAELKDSLKKTFAIWFTIDGLDGCPVAIRRFYQAFHPGDVYCRARRDFPTGRDFRMGEGAKAADLSAQPRRVRHARLEARLAISM
jgi:hypothetical protein